MEGLIKDFQDDWMHVDPLFELFVVYSSPVREYAWLGTYFPLLFAPSKVLNMKEAYSLTLVFTVVEITKLWSIMTVEVPLDFLPAFKLRSSSLIMPVGLYWLVLTGAYTIS